MTLRLLILLSLLAACASNTTASGITLLKSHKLVCSGVSPVAFTRVTFLTLEFQAWHFNDNTIQLYLITSNNQPDEAIVTWKVPKAFGEATAFRLNAIDAQTDPYPTASWIVANNTHAARFQCGPGLLCYPTANPLLLNINSSRPILRIEELQPNIAATLVLFSVDHVVIIEESQTALSYVNGYSWSNQRFLQKYPAASITGTSIAHHTVGSKQYYQLLIGYSASDQLDVGYVLNLHLNPDNGVYTLHTVTLLPSSPQIFYSHPNQQLTRMIYYWLTQSKYVDANTKNAFCLSMGGANQNLPLASAVFKPNESWSPELFLLDDYTQTALIASGSDISAGFNAWSPVLSSGTFYPEVTLRSPTNMGKTRGFSRPRFGARMYGNLFNLGVVSSYNLNDHCWYSLLLDWATATLDTKRNADNIPNRAARDIQRKVPSFVITHPEPSRTPVQQLEFAMRPQNTGFAPNCKESTCNFDDSGDCPVEHCWGKDDNTGFYCCKNPPV